ncbi:MAG: Imm1 family immunity protein [Chthonomonadales bacterium]
MFEEKLAFEGPDGELLLEPTVEQIRDLLLLGSDYWAASSAGIGYVQLRDRGYSNNCERPFLYIIQDDQYGVHLNYQIMDYKPFGKNVNLMTKGDWGDDETVTVSLGGEDVDFPASSFVPLDLACQIIADFLLDQKLPDRVTWVKAPI